MKLVLRSASATADVEAEFFHGDVTLAELLRAAGLESTEATLLVDDVEIPASTPLQSARLTNGSVIEVRDVAGPAPASEVGGERRDDALVDLHQIGGLASGGSLPLETGRYQVGADGPVRSELQRAGVNQPTFQLIVHPTGLCEIEPVTGQSVLLDGVTITGRVAVTEQIIDVDGAMFRVTPAATERSRRRVHTGPEGTTTFSRIPRSPIRTADSETIDIPDRPLADDARRMSRRDRIGHDADVRAATIRFAQQLDTARRAALRRARLGQPDVAELRARARLLSPQLWERRPTDADFLTLSPGFGTSMWRAVTSAPSHFAELESIVRLARPLPAVPIRIPLDDVIAVGIAGPRHAAHAVARWLVLEAAILHGPADLSIHLLTGLEQLDGWSWLKWLPHAHLADGRHRVAVTVAEAAAVLAPLSHVGVSRAGGGQPERADDDQRALVVIDALEHLEGRLSPARTLLSGRGRPTRALVLADRADELPPGCGAIIHVDDDGRMALEEPNRSRRETAITAVGVSHAAAATTARQLAILDDLAGGAVATAPTRLHLVDLLGSEWAESTANRILERWRDSAVLGRVSAPVGRGERAPVEIDLAMDGPHGFVAGTTGPETSEFLRSLLLSFACSVGPDRLTLALVDVEGLGTFRPLAMLPHVVASPTGPDPRLASQLLRVLQSELQRRARADGALSVEARLLVVIDAVDTIAAELPDFVTALVDVAQRGEQLGLHLLLVTRRSDSVLAGSVRAQTSIRFALQGRQPSNSLDLLRGAESAALPADRAFVRVGSGEVVAFQTPTTTGTRLGEGGLPITIRPFSLRRYPLDDAVSTGGPIAATGRDLDELVLAASSAASRVGSRPERIAWPASLPDSVDAESLMNLEPSRTRAVPIGMHVDRSNHQPTAHWWNSTQGNLVVYGVKLTDTTSVLATVAIGLTARHGSDEIELLVIDSGSGALAPLAALQTCRSYAPVGSIDRVIAMLEHLESERAKRALVVDEGRAEASGLPFVVVLVNDYGETVEALEAAGEEASVARLVEIMRNGPTVGIVTVVSTPYEQDIPEHSGTTAETRLVLRLGDPSAYRAFGLRPEQVPTLGPMRAIDPVDGAEVQLASFGTDLGAAVASFRRMRPRS